MAFRDEIETIYEAPNHMLPFIGSSYEDASPGVLRVAVIGINTYWTQKWWSHDPKVLGPAWAEWWTDAGRWISEGHQGVEPVNITDFHLPALRETDKLAKGLKPSFPSLSYGDASDITKHYYCTNAVKVILGPEGLQHNAWADQS